MSCYHLLVAVPSGRISESGKEKLKILGSVKNYDSTKIKDSILLPCGNCIGCRLDYSRRWADRMMLELETEKKAIFLTLTYNEENVPWINDNESGDKILTLNKRDFQLFMKRLRKHYGELRIRFYAAGEYGEKQRPHYHCILYGLAVDDIADRVCFRKNELGDQFYISKTLSEIWEYKGYIIFSDVTWKTCAYVARYVTKKVNGKLYDDKYGSSGRVKEFSLMSRKPGIAGLYLDMHPDCLDLSNINISTPEGGLKIMLPKYYLDKLDDEKSSLYNPEKYAKIKEDRKRFAADNMLLQLNETDLGLADYLETKEMNKIAKLKGLPRNKVR